MEGAAKQRLIETSDPAVADEPFLGGRRSPVPAFVNMPAGSEQLRIKLICLRHQATSKWQFRAFYPG